MTQIVSSISSIEIYAPSAGFAPTNSADVSAIASGYQVVSATATQLYAGTAFLTGVNGTPMSASRAGQAANASMANSAYYDGTGRLISALPDEATVSSIASSYAESAASGKQDESAMSSYLPYSAISADGNSAITSINGSSVGESVDLGIWKGMPYTPISGESGFSSVNGYRPVAKFFVNDAVWADNGTGGSYTEMHMNPTASPFLLNTGIYGPLSYATGGVLAYGSYFDTATQVFGGFLKGNEWYISNATAGKALRGEVHASRGVHISGVYTAGYAFDLGTFGLKISSDPTATAKFGVDEYDYWNAKLDSSASSSFYGADNPSGFITGVDLSNYATTSYVDSSVSGKLDTTSQVVSSTAGDGTYITAINGMGISGQGGGGGVDSATVSAIASSYAESAVSSKADSSALSSYALSADVSSCIDTVSANSASWGGGGIDSATCSAIASSYAESAASSRLYSSAMQVVANSSQATATGVLYILTGGV